MRKRTAEDHLALADCRIDAAQERIRCQKRQLLHMNARGQDASLKILLISFLRESVESMRRYRAGVLLIQRLEVVNKAGPSSAVVEIMDGVTFGV